MVSGLPTEELTRAGCESPAAVIQLLDLANFMAKLFINFHSLLDN